MAKRLLLVLVMVGCAFAQDDADIPPKFKNLITEDQYEQLRDAYLNLLRGLPADPSLREKAVAQLQTQQLLGPRLAASTWVSLGPSPIPNGQVTGGLAVSGRVTAFEIDPTNTNKIYLGTAQGGIYRSLNAGTTWTQIFDGAKSSAIGALALAPSDTTKLFVGTGEANLSGDSYAGVGVYRIDNCDTSATLVGPINPVRSYNDGGGNPVSAPVFNGSSISSILVHPTDPTTIFVATTTGVMGIGSDSPFGNVFPPHGMLGVYRLTNATSAAASVVAQKLTVTLAGSGFDLPNTGNRAVNSMVFEPGNPNNMLVWVYGNASAGDGGIYRSTNAQAATPTFTQVFTTTVNATRGQLAIYKQASAPNVVAYVATGESNGRLRVSTDGGATWSAVLAGGQGFCDGQCFYNIGLDVLPGPSAVQTDDIIVLGGNVGSASTTHLFAKSTNGGSSFTESSSGLHADTHFIRIDPTNSNVIYHGNDGGIFKSTNGGTSWVSLNTMPINTVQFSGLAVHPTDAKWSIGGTQDNGTNMRKSDGTWTRVDFGDGGYALVDRNATDTTNMTLYHTYFNQTNNLIGFARVLSTACASDGNWAFKGIYTGAVNPTPNCDGSDTFNGIAIADPVLFYAPMELGPGTPNTIYFGAGKVYRSPDKGQTMVAVSQASASIPVSSIAVSPQDDNYRMFGRSNGTVFYTTTGANPMTALGTFGTSPLNKFVGRVKFDPNNKNTAYVCLGGYFGGTSTAQSHVWKVTNLSTGPVITAINNGLPDVPVNAFVVDPADSTHLFAGTDIGVYGSSDSGASWSPFGTGLPVVAVFGMEIQAPSHTLRIGTHGRGLWDIPSGSATPPTPVSVTPNSGSGLTQTFTALYTDTAGAADLSVVSLDIGNPAGALNSCIAVYVPPTNSLYLYSDNNSTLLGPITPGTGATQSNSQCTLSGSGGPVTPSGNNLTVPYAITFNAGFTGSKNIYGFAQSNSSANSGYVLLGSWTPVVMAAINAVSVTPNSGTGLSHTFSALYTDTAGFGDLQVVYLDFGPSFYATHSCIAYYLPGPNQLYLVNDTNSAVVGPITPGGAGSISNSQCALSGLGGAATKAGNNLTVPFALTFQGGFTGSKNIFGYAQNFGGMNSGVAMLGTWTPAANPPLAAISVSPSSGSGFSQTFAAAFGDPAGASDVQVVYLEFATAAGAAHSCDVVYIQAGNGLYLYNDTNSALLGPITPGTASTLSNSQCTISGIGGPVNPAGTFLNVPVAVTFAIGFNGAKSVFGFVQSYSGMNGGFQTLGSWTVPQLGASSMTPSNGVGLAQTFSTLFVDKNGFADIQVTYLDFGSTPFAPNSCIVGYIRATDQLFLFNDASSGQVGGFVTPGDGGTASNSQCTITGAGGVVGAAGTNLVVPVAITFLTGFTGPKNVYGYAQNYSGMNSGFLPLGTWTPANVSLAAVSTSPINGGGLGPLTFSTLYTDPAGASDLQVLYLDIGSSIYAVHSCIALYIPGSNVLYLLNDGNTAILGPITPGGGGSVSNSQCILSGVGGAVTRLGNNMTVPFGITFASIGFSSTMNLWGLAQSYSGAQSPWTLFGTWTP